MIKTRGTRGKNVVADNAPKAQKDKRRNASPMRLLDITTFQARYEPGL